MTETVTLKGREYRRMRESTLRHDVWVMERIVRAGLDRPQPGDVESEGRSMVVRASEAGVLFDLLGAALIPADVDDFAWTPELARDTAEFLAGLSDDDDRTIVYGLMAEALVPFFRAAIGSSMTSPSSSRPPASSSGSPDATAAPISDTESGA